MEGQGTWSGWALCMQWNLIYVVVSWCFSSLDLQPFSSEMCRVDAAFFILSGGAFQCSGVAGGLLLPQACWLPKSRGWSRGRRWSWDQRLRPPLVWRPRLYAIYL